MNQDSSDQDLHAEWGKRVRAAREEAGLLQAELAEKVGVYQQVISRIESGRRPADSLRPKLAAALGKSLDELFPYPDSEAVA